MFSKPFYGLAIVALASPLVSAVGYIEIENNCNYDVYDYAVYAGGAKYNGVTPAHSGHSYNLPNPSGSVSLKFGPTEAIAQAKSDPGGLYGPLQVEVGRSANGASFNYDFSTLDGNPFPNIEMALIPSDSTCQKVTCAPGQNHPRCSPGAYYPGEPAGGPGGYNPNYGCGSNAILYVYFCAS